MLKQNKEKLKLQHAREAFHTAISCLLHLVLAGPRTGRVDGWSHILLILHLHQAGIKHNETHVLLMQHTQSKLRWLHLLCT